MGLKKSACEAVYSVLTSSAYQKLINQVSNFGNNQQKMGEKKTGRNLRNIGNLDHVNYRVSYEFLYYKT